ncbi:MAG: hypothetical protein WBA73_21625 [Devosia sp.]
MLKAAIAWLNASRQRHARHLALTELLTMDSHRLEDLGISITDVMLAIEDQRHPLKPIDSSPPRGTASCNAERTTLRA